MRFSAKYLLIILVFFVASQQGFWAPLTKLVGFSTKSEQLTLVLKDAFQAAKQGLVVDRFDLPHTQIKVDWTKEK